MIITCPNCKKNFKIDNHLLPKEGRELKCGSCDHVWFYKIEDDRSKPQPLDDDIFNNKDEQDIVENENDEIGEIKESILENKTKKKEKENSIKIVEEQIPKSNNKIKDNIIGKFFSYLTVFIISFVALIILVDTLKVPLINVFPDLEVILFSLFETFQDIKLFIIDLF